MPPTTPPTVPLIVLRTLPLAPPWECPAPVVVEGDGVVVVVPGDDGGVVVDGEPTGALCPREDGGASLLVVVWSGAAGWAADCAEEPPDPGCAPLRGALPSGPLFACVAALASISESSPTELVDGNGSKAPPPLPPATGADAWVA